MRNLYDFIVTWKIGALPLAVACLLIVIGAALASAPRGGLPPSAAETYALRLRPGQDLRRELLAFARERHLKAACVLSIAGSLRRASLRLADAKDASFYPGPFEIVSLGGTLTDEGCHLHLSISDARGQTLGGHLVDGCQVYTTAEIVIGELTGLQFRREIDPATTFRELVIEKRP